VPLGGGQYHSFTRLKETMNYSSILKKENIPFPLEGGYFFLYLSINTLKKII
jgi:hypothetical protein